MNPEDFAEQARDIQAKQRALMAEVARLHEERERQRLGEIRDNLIEVAVVTRGRMDGVAGAEPRRF